MAKKVSVNGKVFIQISKKEREALRIGYARVSSSDQNWDTQIVELEKYGVDVIVKEKITGISEEKELNQIVEEMQAGDTLVVVRLDRLGRNAKQLLELVEDIQKKQARLVILDVQGSTIDTTTGFGKFFVTILAAVAELERTMLKEKQRRGIDLAKKAGKFNGRPRKLTLNNPQVKQAYELYQEGKYNVREILARTGMKKSSFYKALAEIKEKEGV